MSLQARRFSELVVDEFDPVTSSTMEQYLIAIYKGGNALTNLGYESVRPVNAPEIVLGIVVMFMQVFLMAFILGKLQLRLFSQTRSAP